MAGCDKKQFSKVEAETSLNLLRKKGSFREAYGRIYPCKNCGFWHLTAQVLIDKEPPKTTHLAYFDKWLALIKNSNGR